MEAGREVVWPTALIGKPLHVNICFDEPLVGDIQGIDFSAWAGDSDSPAVAKHEMREVLERFLAKRDELVVLAGGLHPQEAALPLGRQRGKVYRYQGVPVVVSYTPQALLRQAADKGKAWADLCLAMDLLQTPT
jgi:2-succinyl-5-enolpyruvyl-6-hydroxy-3-cyclohexene-1-carboxylate synthase